MADEQTGTNQPQKSGRNKRALNTVITGVIAIVGLAFAGYLFTINQPAVGGTIAGAIIAHYFTAAHGQTTSDQVNDAVRTVGDLIEHK